MAFHAVVEQGQTHLFGLMLAPNMSARLFTNDVVNEQNYAYDIDETDFTEPVFAGYAAAALTSGNWTVTPGSSAIVTHTSVSFTRSATGALELIYGYFVTRDSDDALIWYEEFENGPYVTVLSGDDITFQPKITFIST